MIADAIAFIRAETSARLSLPEGEIIGHSDPATLPASWEGIVVTVLTAVPDGFGRIEGDPSTPPIRQIECYVYFYCRYQDYDLALRRFDQLLRHVMERPIYTAAAQQSPAFPAVLSQMTIVPHPVPPDAQTTMWRGLGIVGLPTLLCDLRIVSSA